MVNGYGVSEELEMLRFEIMTIVSNEKKHQRNLSFELLIMTRTELSIAIMNTFLIKIKRLFHQ